MLVREATPKKIGCLKDGLAGGDVGKAAVDSQGDVLDDRRRLVAVHVNILDCCRLCLMECWFILFKEELATLNRRQEIFSSCRHRARLILNPKEVVDD